MAYENFQNLGSEEKNQEPGKGERSADTPRPASSLVRSLCVHPGQKRVLESGGGRTQHRGPTGKRIQDPQEDRAEEDLRDFSSCALYGDKKCAMQGAGVGGELTYSILQTCVNLQTRDLPAPSQCLPPSALLTRPYLCLFVIGC